MLCFFESRNGIGVAGALSLASGAFRRRTRQLLSMRKKSSTLVCRLSMSSTTKTLEHIVPAYNLPRGRAGEAVQVAAAAEVAAEAPQAVQAAQALEGRTVSRERLPALKREARRRPEPSA